MFKNTICTIFLLISNFGLADSRTDLHDIEVQFVNGSLTSTLENLQIIDALLLEKAKETCGAEVQNIRVTEIDFNITGCGFFDLTGEVGHEHPGQHLHEKSFFRCYPKSIAKAKISCEFPE